MRVLLQRVTQASVHIDGQCVGEIGQGFVLLVGVGDRDTGEEVERLAQKIVNLRVFYDDAGKFNRSLRDVGGAALVVSQFTLYADVRKGRRPSFVHAAAPALAEPVVDRLAGRLRELGVARVATGRFGAMMDVEIHNDGPVTIWLDSDELAG
ncbi:MAG: D-aminoacyl-tRNA deacylase [Phycisphaeraceae bacterium]